MQSGQFGTNHVTKGPSRRSPALFCMTVAITAATLVTAQPRVHAADPSRSKILFSAIHHPDASKCIGCGNIDVYTVLPSARNQQRLTRSTKADDQPAWSPDNRKIVFVRYLVRTDVIDDNRSAIFAMNRNGSDKTRLTSGTKLDLSPTWSPDSTRIVFVRHNSGSIFAVRADGRGQSRLTGGTEARDDQPRWSPDGKNIAFTRNDGTTTTVWMMDADGSNQRQLTSPVGAEDSDPQWSPDGTTVAFVRSFAEANSDIYTVPADGGTQLPLTEDPRIETEPRWSPGGSVVLFTRLHGDDNAELYRVDSDGSRQLRLTRSAAAELYATWSPGGRRIAFIKASNRARDIYIMARDGSPKHQVTNNRLDEYSLDW